MEETLGVHEFIEWVAYLSLQKNPPKAEPFWSDDPKVMADKMREILVPRGRGKPMRRKR